MKLSLTKSPRPCPLNDLRVWCCCWLSGLLGIWLRGRLFQVVVVGLFLVVFH